ncbi:unnamed protein product, partial [Phaeothamnion confervicola]
FPPSLSPDHIRKKNCVSNPRCLFGLGEGKEGIWAKKPPLIAALGPDPDTHIRAGWHDGLLTATTGGPSSAIPTGLKNLGATCYLNSWLQCLFQNLAFRKGVYDWVPTASDCCGGGSSGGSSGGGVSSGGSAPSGDGSGAAENEASTGAASGGGDGGGGGGDVSPGAVVQALQLVFGHMQGGEAAVYDPAPFAALLGLNKGEQQDPQEFNKLFTAMLERCFQQDGTPESLRRLVPSLFRGQLEYVTTCLRCHNVSRNASSFDELELQVKY